MKTFKGIDVSAWQGYIDFNKVKLSGIDFVIIKAGGSDDGFYTDSCFERNYKNAKDCGLKVGCYYFVGSNFDTINNGIKNAEHFAKIIKGKIFDYPIYLDIESTTPEQKYGATIATIAFCDYLEKIGYYVGIYSSSVSGFQGLLDTSRLEKYDKWVAQWANSKPTYPPKYGVWQYTSTGKVNGINCNVDKDISYYDYPNIIKNTNTQTNSNNTNTIDKTHEKFKKQYDKIANDIIKGKYGNGNTRVKKLKLKGYDYNYAQTLVNGIIFGKSISNIHNTFKNKYLSIANNIIKGKYGNGNTRVAKLKSKGYDYSYAQSLVNEILS